MRKLQLTYMLEPAGSHGVWGLDDYHFLPFLFGASELINHPKVLNPESIHNDKMIEEFHEEFIYFDFIKFIKDAKKGTPFYETSPVLNDISAAPTWKKVANVKFHLNIIFIIINFLQGHAKNVSRGSAF